MAVFNEIIAQLYGHNRRAVMVFGKEFRWDKIPQSLVNGAGGFGRSKKVEEKKIMSFSRKKSLKKNRRL